MCKRAAGQKPRANAHRVELSSPKELLAPADRLPEEFLLTEQRR